MCSEKITGTSDCENPHLRVEIVDNWHRNWPTVLSTLEEQGQREALAVDDDGWLSARQVLLVAFDEEENVAGHVCFHVNPASAEGKLEIEARVDAFGTREHDEEIERTLWSAARQRAGALKCDKLVGFVN
jgi:hypothetical protein